MILKKYLNYRFLGQLIKNKSFFKSLSIIILDLKYRIKKSGILVEDENKIFKNFTKSNNFDFYINEIYNDNVLSSHWRTQRKIRRHFKYQNWYDRIFNNQANVLLYYALIRELKPKIIVETGTASGSMTSFILAALNKNKNGKLISIDLPPQKNKMTMNFSLKRNEIGFWIPKEYKRRWSYIEADAKIKLFEICSKFKVDFFIHDSLHTPSHMLLEYAISRRFMSEDTIIASDDILWNDVFENFLDSQKLVGYAPLNNPNLGIFKNKFDNFERKNLT
jgi:cephalosporin hydroxylase